MKKKIIIICGVFFILLFALFGRNYFIKLFSNYNKLKETTTYIGVPVANGDIDSNTIILNEHIIFKEYDSNEISDDVITNSSILIGKTVKNNIKNGYYFTYNDIYE